MRSKTPDPKFAYSIDEAADLLSVRRDSIYELIQNEKLGSFKIGTRRLVASSKCSSSRRPAYSRPASPKGATTNDHR